MAPLALSSGAVPLAAASAGHASATSRRFTANSPSIRPASLRLQRFGVRAEEGAEQKETEQPKTIYADENPEEGFFKSEAMSEAQKQKLRDEYYGFGGSPNKPMGANYFLNIIVVITLLAVTCAFLGYI